MPTTLRGVGRTFGASPGAASPGGRGRKAPTGMESGPSESAPQAMAQEGPRREFGRHAGDESHLHGHKSDSSKRKSVIGQEVDQGKMLEWTGFSGGLRRRDGLRRRSRLISACATSDFVPGTSNRTVDCEKGFLMSGV